MSKEVRLYAPITQYTVDYTMGELNDAGKNPVLRVCTQGGNVRAGWGFLAKLKERGDVHCKVDGAADSFGCYIPMFCKSSECLDQSTFVLHRADMYVETPEDQTFLNNINNDLKAAFKARLNEDEFKSILGVTIDELFDPNTRKDYVINGEQAVKIGLVDKSVKVTPELAKEIEAYTGKFFQVAAQNTNNEKMTIEEIKVKSPDAYAAIYKAGQEAERKRVQAWSVFASVDAEAVKKGIESGNEITSLEVVQFMEKKFSPEALSALKNEAAPAANTAAPAAPSAQLTDEQKKQAEAAAAEKQFFDELNNRIKAK